MATKTTRAQFLAASAGALVSVSAFGSFGALLGSQKAVAALPSNLEIFSKGYPRAFFFVPQTTSDPQSGQQTYEEWENDYLALNGVLGKVLSEERGFEGPADNMPYVRRYKSTHPEKIAILYFNARGRVASDKTTSSFYGGHWLYYASTKLTKSVGSATSETVLRVSDPSAFSMERYAGTAPDDIALVSAEADGKPDWGRVEHVRLRSIKAANKAIVVERGAYGGRTLSFPAGAYLAPHVMSGASTPEEVPFWSYNYSTLSPKDAQGRTGGEALVDYLAGLLGPGGELSVFDGVTFDAFDFVAEGRPVESIDANGDGKADGANFGGVNVYGLGTFHFTRNLRTRLPDKIITADSTYPERLQRSFGHLNGVESEGYPDLFDHNLENTSKGTNLFAFWKQNSVSPSLNYVNFKFRQATPARDRNTFREPNLSEDQSYRKFRLVLASAVLNDAAITYPPDWNPPETVWGQTSAPVRVFDELWQGVDQKPNWLGMPQGDPVLMASRAPDLLRGQGKGWPQAFVGRFRGKGVAFSRAQSSTGTSMVIRSTKSASGAPPLSGTLRFALEGVQVSKSDVFVELQLSASPLASYPATMARRVYVSAVSDRGTRRESFTWAGQKPFNATFYFRGVGPGRVALKFGIEGYASARFVSLAVRSAADAAYRVFENGAVFVNNSDGNFGFDLQNLLPNISLRRIQGSEGQDTATNSGRPLGDTLVLRPKDALFTLKDGVSPTV